MSNQENRKPKCETCSTKDNCPIIGTGAFEHSSTMKMSELPPFLRMMLNSTYGANGDVIPHGLSLLQAVRNGDFPTFMRIMEENRKEHDPRAAILKAKISSAKELVAELEKELADMSDNKASNDTKSDDNDFIKGVPGGDNKCTCDACQGKNCNTSASEEPDEPDEDEIAEYIQRRIYDFFEMLKNDYDPETVLNAINDLELEGYPPILKLFDYSEHMLNSINDTLADTDGSVDEINSGVHLLSYSNETIVRHLAQIIELLKSSQKVQMSSMYGSSGNNAGPFHQPEMITGVAELRSFPESPELTPLFEKYLKMLIDKRAKRVFDDKKYKLMRKARKAAIGAVENALARRDEGIFEDQLPFFDDREDFDNEIIDMITSRIEGYLAAGQDGNNILRSIITEELSKISRENQLKEDRRIKTMIREEIKKANQ